jgi:hypothetical protein
MMMDHVYLFAKDARIQVPATMTQWLLLKMDRVNMKVALDA